MEEYVIRIDQGDYLQERGGCDWGRNLNASARRPQAGATVYPTREAAERAIDRLQVRRLVRSIEVAD